MKPCDQRMWHRVAFVVTVCAALCITGCSNLNHQTGGEEAWSSHVVTADIQAGIETHIDHQTHLDGGAFPLVVKGTDLDLKLVRIHTEYLATLGPREHFACVDLVDTNGDVYDVDFFMHGDPGNMKVTETIPHKINGKPFYFWKQNDDKTWGRVPVDEASQELMGVIVPEDTFEFRYQMTLPEISGQAGLWIPLPTSDAFQTVTMTSIDEPREHRVLEDKTHGNKALYWALEPSDSGKPIDVRYNVQRIEKAAYRDEQTNQDDYLAANTMVPNDPEFEKIAAKAVQGKATNLQRARALYDLVIDELRYAKAGDGWGQGNAVFACDSRHGNCTDFHAYFTALARAIDIPARFAIGAAIPASRDEGGVDGYHCWVEFYADEKWWPVDISEADKYSALSTYYFGHHPANRIEFSRGRDLEFEPGPKSGPINFFAYPVLEIDAAPVKVPISFTFRRHTQGDSASGMGLLTLQN
ncbi:MAG: transglutaminase domain-containing protein [Phycisphaeraceae bacterium]|nr:transglutaminase domain-containing protein [Phycisphaeraceae bacterium]